MTTKQATGPKSARGKFCSSRNSIRHGLFARELLVVPADQTEFDRFQHNLMTDLAPRSELHKMAAQMVVASAWRYKLAVRLEATWVAERLAAADRKTEEPVKAPESPLAMKQWFGASPYQVQHGIRFLETIATYIKQSGRIPDDAREEVIRGFGEEFYSRLSQWDTSGLVSVQIAETMRLKSERYDLEKLDVDNQVREKTILDPYQQRDGMLKLIDFQISHLRNLSAYYQQKEGHSSVVEGRLESDAAPRYLTSLGRELQRAVVFYVQLQGSEGEKSAETDG